MRNTIKARLAALAVVEEFEVAVTFWSAVVAFETTVAACDLGVGLPEDGAGDILDVGIAEATEELIKPTDPELEIVTVCVAEGAGLADAATFDSAVVLDIFAELMAALAIFAAEVWAGVDVGVGETIFCILVIPVSINLIPVSTMFIVVSATLFVVFTSHFSVLLKTELPLTIEACISASIFCSSLNLGFV